MCNHKPKSLAHQLGWNLDKAKSVLDETERMHPEIYEAIGQTIEHAMKLVDKAEIDLKNYYKNKDGEKGEQ